MNISLPAPLRDWVSQQVQRRGFGTASEFVRDMIRREREQSLQHQIDRHLLAAVDTPVSPMTDEDWRDIATRGKRRAAKRPAAGKPKKKS